MAYILYPSRWAFFLSGRKEKRMKTILNLPHCSTKLPKCFYKGLLIPKDKLLIYNLKMSDLFTKELFKDINGKRVCAKYSRLFCDVERFKDDSKEVMAKYGEGVIYTKMFDGLLFHEHDIKYQKRVFKYYDNYHKRLDKYAKAILKNDDLLIIDCHSFSDSMASYFYSGSYPDVCIGVEEEYKDEKILQEIINIIIEKGYSYKINYPYSGSIVPNYVLNNKTNRKVITVMIEVNKRIYL